MPDSLINLGPDPLSPPPPPFQMNLNQILLHCDTIENNFIGGKLLPVLRTFPKPKDVNQEVT
jgi:hypothetical protein